LGGDEESERGKWMKTLFSYLALSGILIGASITFAAQTGPNKQGGQRKERTQVLIVDKRDGGRGGNGNSERAGDHVRVRR
jgi:hypothetical protein